MHDSVNIVSTEQKLLFDIRQLLIEQNDLLKSIAQDRVIPTESIPLALIPTAAISTAPKSKPRPSKAKPKSKGVKK